MTQDEQIKMLKEQFRKEFIDKACDWIRDRNRHACKEWLDKECEDFRKAMTEKTNPLFEKCLANVNPETRAEVRKNIDLANLLTWEDVQSIVEIADEMIQTAHDRVKWEDSSPEAYYKEVLTKFNEKKYDKGI